jgi:hypothetical protein
MMASKWRLLVVIILAGWSCLCANKSVAMGDAKEEQGSNRMGKLFEHTKTVCIGRFLIDVPVEAKLVYGPAELPHPIARIVGRGARFDDVIKQRKAEIENARRKYALGSLAQEGSLLGKVLDGRGSSQKVLFGLSRESGSNYVLESYQAVGDDIYVQEVVPYGKDYNEELDELNAISHLLVPRQEDEIPSGQGICLDGAFIIDPARPIYEHVTFGIRFATFKDVHFSIEMTKKDILVASDALEHRIRRAEAEARKAGEGKWYDKVKVFRQGQRNIGTWSGYEYLAWKPPLGEAPESHVFAYVSQGTPSDPFHPVLDIALDTGVKGNQPNGTVPSITNEEAIYLWDRLTASLRPKPAKATL